MSEGKRSEGEGKGIIYFAGLNLFQKFWGSFEVLFRFFELFFSCMFNRPGVAGAVLQTPPSFIN